MTAVTSSPSFVCGLAGAIRPSFRIVHSRFGSPPTWSMCVWVMKIARVVSRSSPPRCAAAEQPSPASMKYTPPPASIAVDTCRESAHGSVPLDVPRKFSFMADRHYTIRRRIARIDPKRSDSNRAGQAGGLAESFLPVERLTGRGWSAPYERTERCAGR